MATPTTGRGRRPYIIWGSPAKTIYFAQPIQAPLNGPRLRPGSAVRDMPSGLRDVYVTGLDQVIEGTVRFIPIVNQSTPLLATGWDGGGPIGSETAPEGWQHFLEWAWAGNVFEFYPDTARYPFNEKYSMILEEPSGMEALAQSLETGHRYRSLYLRMRTADGARIVFY